MSMYVINTNPSAKRAYIDTMKEREEAYYKANPDSVTLQFVNELRLHGFEFELSQQALNFMPKHKKIILPIAIKYYQEAKRRGKSNEQNTLLGFFHFKGLEEVIPMLLEDYHSSETEDGTRWIISDCLYQIRSKRYIKEYLEIIVNPQYGMNRQMLILLVGEFKVEEAIPVLIQLLEEEDVRLHAISALGYYKREEFRPYFERFETDKHLGWRKYARAALRKLEDGRPAEQKKKYNILEVLDMLDWDNSQEVQEKGLALAREEKCIKDFLGPGSSECPKSVWDNCALILSERDDEELKPYLQELLEWLQDMNWPGAYCILERLGKYRDKDSFNKALHLCIELANSENDEMWLDMLLKLQSSGDERFDEDIKVDAGFQKTIKSIINGWDPVDLLSHAPWDEYDSEIAEIYHFLDTAQDSRELGEGIYNIFIRAFGEDVFRESIDSCVAMAQFIYTAKLWPALRKD